MMNNITPVVKQLLIINIIFFIGSQFVPISSSYFALYYPNDDHFKIWQLITHMFMHANLMHIAFNMFALYSFGSALEHFWGEKKFLFFYISCGLGAALLQLGVYYFNIHNELLGVESMNLSKDTLHQILNVNFSEGIYLKSDLFEKEIKPILQNVGKLDMLNQSNFNSLFKAAAANQSSMVGASGAIYGLLVAFAYMFPNAELLMMFIPIPIKAKYFVPILIFFDLFSGVTGSSLMGSGIAHFAHIGGAVTGFIMMWIWRNNQFKHNRWN